MKGEHQRQFAYEAHTACDKNGFVLETVVTAGNVHDSVAFDDVYDKLVENSAYVYGYRFNNADLQKDFEDYLKENFRVYS